jgi:mutator protein MutT
LIKKDEKVLFVKREHTGKCDGYYMLPGGHVDVGETILDACVRELKEELDIAVLPSDLIFRLAEPTKTHIHLFFEVLKYTGQIKNNEPHKHERVDFLTLDNSEIYPSVVDEVNAMLIGKNFIENAQLPF